MLKLKTIWQRYGHQFARAAFFALFMYAAYGIVHDYRISVPGQLVVWPTAFLLWLFIAVQMEPIQSPDKDEPLLERGGLTVKIKLNDGEFGSAQERDSIHELTDVLDSVVTDREIGEYDGDEFGNGECELYFYSEEPENLYAVIKPFLEKSAYAKSISVHIVKNDGTELDEISLY